LENPLVQMLLMPHVPNILNVFSQALQHYKTKVNAFSKNKNQYTYTFACVCMY
jgi:hypothetical protein